MSNVLVKQRRDAAYLRRTADPCPFCGADADRLTLDRIFTLRVWLLTVRCNQCGAQGPAHCTSSASGHAAAAIRLWNSRAVGAGRFPSGPEAAR